MSLLSEFLKCIHSEYWNDKTKAGVVLSQLSANEVYASVVRYPDGPFGVKQIVCKAKAKTLDAVIRALAIAWLVETKRFEKLRTTLMSPKAFDGTIRLFLRDSL